MRTRSLAALAAVPVSIFAAAPMAGATTETTDAAVETTVPAPAATEVAAESSAPGSVPPTSEPGTGDCIPRDDPLAVEVVTAIQGGDLVALGSLLDQHPDLATAAIGDDDTCGTTRTLLHVVTDWPGYYPNGAETVALLVAAGADVNAHFTGSHSETPLHWAASSDDIEVLDALLDAGADIEATGSVIGGGTPMADATAFANWNAARRLVQRGARTNFWESATLGLTDRLTEHLAAAEAPNAQEITEAFWGACHGNQQAVAEDLLALGADINWIGWDDLTPLDAAQRSGGTALADWLMQNGARSAQDLQ